MQQVSIVTDASCDLPQDMVDEYNIHVVPILVIFGGETVYEFYSESGTITKEEFYQKLKTCKEMPTTAIPSPQTFINVFEEASKEGEKVIAIFVSKKLSGILQSAQRVVPLLEDKDITIIDSLVGGPALGLLALEAAKMAKKNASKEEIIAKLEELIPQASLITIMNTLENVYRSGRVSWVKKFMGETFSIKPIIQFKNGETTSGGTLRGREEVLKRLKFMAPFALKSSITDNIFIWHTRNMKEARELQEVLEEHNDSNKEIRILEAGPIIGGFLGEKMLGLIYLGKYNKKWLLKMKE